MSNDFSLAKELLQKNGTLTGLAYGNSMLPLLRSGKDNAVIAPLPENLKVNDVVLYRKQATNELILHRIIKITANRLVIRGDNLHLNETDVSYKDLVGVLKGFYRNGKYYDCEKSKSYKLYIFYVRASFPVRFLLHKAKSFLRLIIRRIKKHT
jgi:hypothetical protein